MSKEQRKYPRKTVDEPVEVATGNKIYEGTIKDISEGGASVEFRFLSGRDHKVFDIGSRVEMTPEKSARKSGQIIREYVSGMAVKFDT